MRRSPPSLRPRTKSSSATSIERKNLAAKTEKKLTETEFSNKKRTKPKTEFRFSWKNTAPAARKKPSPKQREIRMSLEDRVLQLEAQVEAEKRRADRVLLRLAEVTNKLYALESRIAGLADEVGHVLEARECESDSGHWSSLSGGADSTTLSDDDDDSAPSEEIPVAPIRLSKLVKPDYEPVPTKKLAPTTSAGTATAKKSKAAKKSTTTDVAVALTKKFKPPAKVTAGGSITIKKRKTQE
jgi:hypothetical protein